MIEYDASMTFREKVYTLIRIIPKGKVATYGQVAGLVGSPRAARAVGMCMKTNPDAPRTPCHRIVASDGRLTGYSAEGGVVKKRQMLIEEGVHFHGTRVDLKTSLWHPTT
jgi:methylated-DNA-protein-cysteine methyltransferase-like protein